MKALAPERAFIIFSARGRFWRGGRKPATLSRQQAIFQHFNYPFNRTGFCRDAALCPSGYNLFKEMFA
jgi:hypothetical protein